MCLSEVGSSASGQILTTRQFRLFDGKVRAFAFGRPHDWNRMVTDNKLDQFAVLARHVKECGVTRVFTPLAVEDTNLKGDAIIRERTVGTVINDDPDFFREKIVVDGVEFYFGGDADGIRLTEFGAYFLPSADCYTLVLRMPDGTVVGCHGGRNSLIEPAEVRVVSHAQYQSVAIAALQGWYGRGDDVQTAMLCGIKAQSFRHPFDHPDYGEVNRKLAAHLVQEFGPDVVEKPYEQCPIDLAAVVRVQLERLGVPTDPDRFSLDPTDTATEMDESGEYLWHSNRRGDTTRNGVLVVRLL